VVCLRIWLEMVQLSYFSLAFCLGYCGWGGCPKGARGLEVLSPLALNLEQSPANRFSSDLHDVETLTPPSLSSIHDSEQFTGSECLLRGDG
jgi:hypothetical protein